MIHINIFLNLAKNRKNPVFFQASDKGFTPFTPIDAGVKRSNFPNHSNHEAQLFIQPGVLQN